MNNRKQIRNKVKEILTTQVGGQYPTMAQSRVYTNRQDRAQSDEYPYIDIVLKSEKLEKDDQSPRTKKRRLALHVECVVNKTTEEDDLEDKCDDFCGQVENIFNEHRFLGDLVEDTDQTDVESDISHEGEEPIGGIRLIYEITYISNEFYSPELNDFKTINQKFETDENIMESEINLAQ